MADARIRVIGEDEATKELDKIDKSLGGFKDSFTELQSKLELGQQALELFLGTFQKAFEMGREGAVFTQTGESFDGLIAKVGASTNTLDELRSASKGTVDDLTLMSSVLTLAAGAGDDFAKDLVNATPELLNIAKASNKLNPSLGDTAFLFESISTGIKRGSPLILDNLGITVRLEEAYQEYAESLGKAASELTSTEQKQALLNKVLAQGDILIQQAGGNTDSAVDAYDRLGASLENISNTAKAKLAPSLAEAAGALELLLTWTSRLEAANQEHSASIAATAAGYDEYFAEMQRMAEAQGLMLSVTDNGIAVINKFTGSVKNATETMGIMTPAMYEAYLAANNLQGAYDGVAGGQAQMNLTAEQVIAAQERMIETTQVLTEEQVKLLAEMDKLALTAGTAAKLSTAWEEYKQKARETTEENAALRAEIERLIAEGVDPASQEIADLSQEMRDNVEAQVALGEATNKATREFIYQKAAASMNTDAALMLARAMGILSEQDYSLARQVIDLTVALDGDNSAMVEGYEVTDQYLQQIELLTNATRLAETNLGNFTGETDEYIEQAKQAQQTTEDWAGATEALNAGLSGTYARSVDQYKQKVAETAEENNKLALELAELSAQGNLTSDAYARITERINENNAAQKEAHELLRQSTAEMIYQQAAAGLGAEDALYLARAMGLVSEEDYKLIMQLQELRRQFDSNGDGAITAAEGARQYTARVVELYQSVDRLNQSLASSPLGGGGGGGGGMQVGAGMVDLGGGIYQYTAPGSEPPAGGVVNVTYVNNGVTMENEANLQRLLEPVYNTMAAGR